MRSDSECSRYVSHLRQWVFALADINFSIHTRGFSEYGGILLLKSGERLKGRRVHVRNIKKKMAHFTLRTALSGHKKV